MDSSVHASLHIAHGRLTSLLFKGCGGFAYRRGYDCVQAAYCRAEMCFKAQTIICAYSSHAEWTPCGHYFLILSGVFGCGLCPGLCWQPSRQWRVGSVCETPSTYLTRFFFFFSVFHCASLTSSSAAQSPPPPPDSMTHLNLVIALHRQNLNKDIATFVWPYILYSPVLSILASFSDLWGSFGKNKRICRKGRWFVKLNPV